MWSAQQSAPAQGRQTADHLGCMQWHAVENWQHSSKARIARLCIHTFMAPPLRLSMRWMESCITRSRASLASPPAGSNNCDRTGSSGGNEPPLT
jgi:hypothetical protein